MAELTWGWLSVPKDGNPDDCNNVLVEGEGLLPGPRVILECGNIDAVDRDKIAAVQDLLRALNTAPVIRLTVDGLETYEQFAERYKRWHREVKVPAERKARGMEVPDAE